MAGETTSVSAAARVTGNKLPLCGALTGKLFTIPYATTQLELADVMEVGYIPEAVTLVGFLYAPTDMDSATGMVQKITVGGTDVATSLTGGQTGAKSYVAITPIVTTAPTLVSVTTTTAPTTPVAGTLYLTPIYFTH